MKNFYRLILGCIFPFSLFAQDYAPFPYDSVFFESSIPNSDLMPVVKSPNIPNKLQLINNYPNLSKVALGFNYSWGMNYYMRPSHWTGYSYSPQNVLYFCNGFFTGDPNVYSECIKIDLDNAVLEKDTILFVDPIRHFGDQFYLEVQYDSLIETTLDTIKQYSFQILDSNFSEINFDVGYELDTLHFNVNNQLFQISKNNGILKCPDFAYFPYTKQYSLKGKVKDILDIETDHFHKVFELEPGDEIHTRTFGSGDVGRTFNRYSRKIVCTDQEFDSSANVYYTNYDVWTRYDKSVFSYYTMIADSGFVYSIYEEIIDTIYLDAYEDLNVKIPNGFGSTNDYNSKGFFYRDASETLIYFEEYVFLYMTGVDSIELFSVADGGQEMDYYPFGLANKFWDNKTVWGEAYSKPVYVSTSDTTWGIPFSDAFLDIVENSTAELVFYIQNTTIFPPTDIAFQDFRIYDISGKLLNYYKASESETGIDISQYEKGAYILVAYDGKTAYHFKFIR